MYLDREPLWRPTSDRSAMLILERSQNSNIGDRVWQSVDITGSGNLWILLAETGAGIETAIFSAGNLGRN